MNPKQWLRGVVAQIDAMPERERLAVLMAGLALLVGLEFMVVLPMQTQRESLAEMALSSAEESAKQQSALAEEQAQQEKELDLRLQAANEALRAFGVNSGVVGTRGESLSFLLSRTLRDSPVQVVGLRAIDAEEMTLAPRRAEGEEAPAEEPKGQVLFRHRYVLSLSGEFTAVTGALDTLEEALKPLRIEKVRVQGRPDGSVVATVHWVTIGLERSWLSL
ncbi:MAG: hypothetical protein V4739_00340 [Pseudomonadota bacterium]